MRFRNKDASKALPVTTTHRKSPVPSVFGMDMHILGNIVSEGMIDFNGHLEGNIRCSALTLRPNAEVKGDILAESVQIFGKVSGLIRAKNVYLFASCHVEGIIMHETIAIEDGAFLDGKCKRTDKICLDDENIQVTEESDQLKPDLKILENIRLIS
jgi:cytoskeletal protein CcmA (bactofilin family)